MQPKNPALHLLSLIYKPNHNNNTCKTLLHIRRLFYTPKFSLHHSIKIYEQKLAIFLINQLTAPSYHTHFSLEKQLALIIHALYYSKHSCKPLTKGICYEILYLSHNNQKYARHVLSRPSHALHREHKHWEATCLHRLDLLRAPRGSRSITRLFNLRLSL